MGGWSRVSFGGERDENVKMGEIFDLDFLLLSKDRG